VSAFNAPGTTTFLHFFYGITFDFNIFYHYLIISSKI
jgi:hypothetical protein